MKPKLKLIVNNSFKKFDKTKVINYTVKWENGKRIIKQDGTTK